MRTQAIQLKSVSTKASKKEEDDSSDDVVIVPSMIPQKSQEQSKKVDQTFEKYAQCQRINSDDSLIDPRPINKNKQSCIAFECGDFKFRWDGIDAYSSDDISKVIEKVTSSCLGRR